jgi:hypothetical protein
MRFLSSKAIMAILIGAFLLLPATGRGGEPLRLQEQKIKAGLLYNFIKYTTWPEEAFSKPEEPFQICLLGGDAFDGALDPLNGRTAQMRLINIREIGSLDSLSSLGECHIVFVHRDMKDGLSDILLATKNYPILTISDIEDFARKGGMVEFSQPSGKRISLYLNTNAIQQGGLRVGDPLIKLSEIR